MQSQISWDINLDHGTITTNACGPIMDLGMSYITQVKCAHRIYHLPNFQRFVDYKLGFGGLEFGRLMLEHLNGAKARGYVAPNMMFLYFQ